MTRNSVLLWSSALGLALAGAAPAAATVRMANFAWTPATGPVHGYIVYVSVDGAPDEYNAYVNEANTAIEVESGASLTVSVAAFDITGRQGPRSDPSPPLRLCPGDFDADELIGTEDWEALLSCFGQQAAGPCAAGDIDDDGHVYSGDIARVRIGADACSYLRPPAGCPGDMNGDGRISAGDIAGVQQCVGFPAQGGCTHADFDGSGFVSTVDFILTKRAYGTSTCP